MSETDPYQAPQADVAQQDPQDSMQISGPRRVNAGQGWAWISKGFEHFGKNPFAWIFAFVIWVVIAMIVILIPLLGNLAMSIFGPVILAGFMLGAHAQANGENFELGHLFAGFSSGNVGQLILVGVLYLVGSFIVGILVAAMFVGVVAANGGIEMLTSGDFTQFMQNPENLLEFLLAALVFLLLITPLVMLYWFAPALVVLHQLPAIEAMKLSFKGCLQNVLPFLVYGVIGIILSLIAVIPLFLGLLVMCPVFLASIYVSYRDIYTK